MASNVEELVLSKRRPAGDGPSVSRKQMLIDEAKERMAEINDTPVQYGDNWLSVRKKMMHSGWNFYVPTPYINGVPIGGSPFVYLLPSGRKPRTGGKVGVDWLESERDVMQFAIDHFNWCGEFNGVDVDTSKMRQDWCIADSLRKLYALSDGPSPNDSWTVFWGKMQQVGWKLGSEDSRWRKVHIPPTGECFNGNGFGGENGIDYFTSEDEVKQFAIDHLGWKGGLKEETPPLLAQEEKEDSAHKPKVDNEAFLAERPNSSSINDLSFEEIEKVYLEKKRERDDVIAAKRLPFEKLEKIYRERKRQRTTIDLTEDNAGPVEPDETDSTLRNMAKQAKTYATKLVAVKKEMENTKEDLEDANELVQQQTLTVDVWQSRFDELAKEPGLDAQKINEIRNRPLSSGR